MERFRSARWFKSSRSGGNGNCLETAFVPEGVAVRDSKDGTTGPILLFTRAEWDAFLAGAKVGEFDLPA